MILPAKLVAMALALLSGLFITGLLSPDRFGPDDLQIGAEVAQRADGLVELRLVWHWEESGRLWLGKGREELLAVSFDTRELLFEAEEAAYGVGANGESMQVLEQVAGFNGARRFFVVPRGYDGEARLLLRPINRGGATERVVQVHAVVGPDLGEEAVQERLVRIPPSGEGTGRLGYET